MYFLAFMCKFLKEWNFGAAYIQMIILVRKCQLMCWNGCSILCPHEEYTRVPLTHNRKMLGVTSYLSFVNLIDIKLYRTVILICIPLISKGRGLWWLVLNWGFPKKKSCLKMVAPTYAGLSSLLVYLTDSGLTSSHN